MWVVKTMSKGGGIRPYGEKAVRAGGVAIIQRSAGRQILQLVIQSHSMGLASDEAIQLAPQRLVSPIGIFDLAAGHPRLVMPHKNIVSRMQGILAIFIGPVHAQDLVF